MMIEKFIDLIYRPSIQNHRFRAIVFSGGYSFFSVLLIGTLSFQETFSRQLEFVSEEIELLVGDSTCTVNGSYWFRNMSPSSINNVLFYPFVVNEQLPYPDTIIVTDFRTDNQVKFEKSANGIYFEIIANTFETSLYRVSYTQRTYAFSMQYLLRTTAQWKKPLEQAVYRVRIPNAYTLTSSTIMFPQMREQNDEQIFEICEENFMPSTDFVIQWERRLP